MNFCPRCGKDLDAIPDMYKPFVHLNKQRVWCVDWSIDPEVEQMLEELANRIVQNMRETLDRIIVEGE